MASPERQQRPRGTGRLVHRQENRTELRRASFYAPFPETLFLSTASPTLNPAHTIRDEFDGTEEAQDFEEIVSGVHYSAAG